MPDKNKKVFIGFKEYKMLEFQINNMIDHHGSMILIEILNGASKFGYISSESVETLAKSFGLPFDAYYGTKEIKYIN